MKISAVLENIDQGALALPEFRRGYVWNRAQGRGLTRSLHRRCREGGRLTWLTKTEAAEARGDAALQPCYVALLLDGQRTLKFEQHGSRVTGTPGSDFSMG